MINGVGSPVTEPGSVYTTQLYGTVEKQFEFIRQELAKRPPRVHVEYDPDDGHPTTVLFGQGLSISDGDYGFEATEFTRLD